MLDSASTFTGERTVPAGDGDALRSPMLELSNAVVRLYKEAFGRGPTKARAAVAGPDTLVVTLEQTLTVAERNLVALGQHERVRQTRMLFQGSLEHEVRALVERTLGRRAIAVISGIDTEHDLAVEMLTLEPVRAPADGLRS
jgi:uncharacterized protein YbcI